MCYSVYKLEALIRKEVLRSMSEVKLRPFQDEDLEVFKKWLDKPHVAKWYAPSEPWINEIEERL